MAGAELHLASAQQRVSRQHVIHSPDSSSSSAG